MSGNFDCGNRGIFKRSCFSQHDATALRNLRPAVGFVFIRAWKNSSSATARSQPHLRYRVIGDQAKA
jgi:hypothetical protein